MFIRMAAFPSGTGRDRSDLNVYVWSIPPRTCAITGPSVSALSRVGGAPPRIISSSYWRTISCGSFSEVAASVENVNMQRSPLAITGVVAVRMSETVVFSITTRSFRGGIGTSSSLQLTCVNGDIGMACEYCDIVKNSTHIKKIRMKDEIVFVILW